MLNVCIVMPRFFPVPAVKGGAVEQLATFLADENEKNHKIDLTFVSVYDELAIEESKKYKYSKFIYIPISLKEEKYNYSVADSVLAEYMNNVEKAIKDKNFDYVIIQGGRKEHIIPSIPYNKSITYLHGPAIEKKLHEYYRAIIVVSHFIANCYYKQTDTPREYVIPLENAIHLEDFAKEISENEKKELKEKYNISKDEIVINFCGRTIAEKGVKELIQAFKQMKNVLKCKLIIMGNCNYAKQVKTPFEEELFKIAEEMKDRIIFTGFMPNKELYKIHN
ncbi:MAG: glycosyltransferase, partial [Clostridia bacterium]|nr:glycosyltransferase [Clostridia bacterium]